MALELFNTLSGNVEPLFASDGQKLRFYCCGPTVYDYGHIGNFRTFLHVDLLRRTARLHGLGLHHVMNITDVDDKIIRNAAAAWPKFLARDFAPDTLEPTPQLRLG